MKFIISPAKTMNVDTDTFAPQALPRFLEQAEELKNYLQSLDYAACKALWNCSDTLAEANFERLQKMDLHRSLTPALFAYEGIQYQYMAPGVFTEEELDYVQEHLRILSGLYGLLRPLDGVTPYRLEMQAKPVGFRCKTLYEFWGSQLADALAGETDCVVDLASKEYSKCILSRLPVSVRRVQVTFAQEVGGKLKEKATFAKMARGAMVRHAAEQNCRTPEELRFFCRFGFAYSPEYSSTDHLVFIQDPNWKSD
ncbi:peroxide stress protein YaaA [Fournierella massiliensis]|uniref:peroxide stress protein YaaA n=1 Tax=Allofournierella massiliensis TaxID=1650663 RepID=UPI0035224056